MHLTKMALVWVAYVNLSVLIYYGLVIASEGDEGMISSIYFYSDVLIFIPAVVASGVHSYLAWNGFSSYRISVRLLLTAVFGVIVLFLSSNVAAFIAFNAWGK